MSEARQFLASLPSKPQFVLVAIAWIVLFQFLGNSSFGYASTPSLFSWLVAVYESNPDDSLGYMIPPLIVALLYAKRDHLVPLEKAPWGPALLLLALAVLLHVVGYLIQQVRVSLLAFGLGIWALTGFVLGLAVDACHGIPIQPDGFRSSPDRLHGLDDVPSEAAFNQSRGRILQGGVEPEPHP